MQPDSVSDFTEAEPMLEARAENDASKTPMTLPTAEAASVLPPAGSNEIEEGWTGMTVTKAMATPASSASPIRIPRHLPGLI
jgi:hypothetical protein